MWWVLFGCVHESLCDRGSARLRGQKIRVLWLPDLLSCCVCVCDLERVTQVASMSSVVDCKNAALILKDYMRSSR